MRIVCVLLVMLSALLAGCVAVGNPAVRNLPTTDMAKAPTALTQYIEENQIPTNWIGGVVFQQRWQRSYGLDSDEHNKVFLRVYIPNKLVFVIPCGPRQEKGFIEDYAPGDIIAMAWDGTARIGASQNSVRLCKEDVVLMKKGGALNISAVGATP